MSLALRCSCGTVYPSALHLVRHQERVAHCPDCGGALIAEADRAARTTGQLLLFV